MVIDSVSHLAPRRKRRNHECRDAEAFETIAAESGIGWRNGSAAGGDMVEEAAPFIEVKDHDSVSPRGTCGDGRINVVQERFAIANVGMRVIIT